MYTSASPTFSHSLNGLQVQQPYSIHSAQTRWAEPSLRGNMTISGPGCSAKLNLILMFVLLIGSSHSDPGKTKGNGTLI